MLICHVDKVVNKYLLSHPFRQNGQELRDEKRTLECLKKAAKIASQCLDVGVQVQLYVELLNHYLFYYQRGNAQITISMLNQVRSLRIFPLASKLIGVISFAVDCQNQRGAPEPGTNGGNQTDRNALPKHAGPHPESDGVQR